MAAMDSHANGLLPPFVLRLAAAHPGISLDIEIASTDRAAATLIDDQVDLVIAFNLAPHREIRIIATEQLPFGCVVAPEGGRTAERQRGGDRTQGVAHYADGR
jgi:DNA-binding transcriptional LysR family regulator